MSMDQKNSGTEFLYEQDKKEKSVGTLILRTPSMVRSDTWKQPAEKLGGHRWFRISTQITNGSKGTW